MNKLKLKTLIVAFTFFIFSNLLFASGDGTMAYIEGVTPISISEVKNIKDKKGVYLLDANVLEVRKQYGYIPGSIPVNVDNWLDKLPKDKNAMLIFYCLNRLCYASSEAGKIAQENGYKNVYVMLDGIEKWILDGNPIEKIPGTDNSIIKKVLANDKLTTSDVKDYRDNIHADVLYGDQPACRDCHGNSKDEAKNGSMTITKQSFNSKTEVNDNCAKCHEKQTHTFYKSVHSQQVNPGSNVPKCSDCHSIHLSSKFFFPHTQIIDVKTMAVDKCGKCHEKETKEYIDTFHGKALKLASADEIPTTASCYDCHGKHNIYKTSNPNSTLYGDNAIATCKVCHTGSNKNFTGYIAHSDMTNKDKYPKLYWTYIAMTGLLVSVFTFFGIHTFLWAMRLIKTRLDNPTAWKLAKEARHNDKIKLKRFTTFQKLEHFFMATSFLGLALSGLPQKFYQADWAQTLIDLMGGYINATKIHHISAIVLGVTFFAHIIEILITAYKNRQGAMTDGKFDFMKFLRKLFGPDSLMPRWQDLIDIYENFKWFLGIRKTRPSFDRFTYWEKFDYCAVFWGMFIIGFSGLVLWFPTFFTKLFPGWFINLCAILHSDEALLATGFIFAIHFFNTHFRADHFPMDTVIFSGYLTEEEARQERGKWLDRLSEEEKEKILIKNDKFAKWSWLAKLTGFILLVIGLIFLFLIVYALVTGSGH